MRKSLSLPFYAQMYTNGYKKSRKKCIKSYKNHKNVYYRIHTQKIFWLLLLLLLFFCFYYSHERAGTAWKTHFISSETAENDAE